MVHPTLQRGAAHGPIGGAAFPLVTGNAYKTSRQSDRERSTIVTCDFREVIIYGSEYRVQTNIQVTNSLIICFY